MYSTPPYDTAALPVSDEGKPRPLSVSAALAQAKSALENINIRLIGEVSELSAKRGYAAVYFTVKDEDASLPCMMWNNRYRASEVQLQVGQLVELTGRFSLYAKKGRMNFDVSHISLAGEGELRMRVAALERKLAAEGLFNPARKRTLPRYPERVGLVTSPRGAAVHDVLRTLKRRYPLAHIIFAGVPVEGTYAPAHIIEGMHTVLNDGIDVLLVVRGGGSFEDLMPFNDESLARAIATCPVPVVTGIGHEPDTSIADKVADLRASTPTAAAEAVAPALTDIAASLDAHAQAMHAQLAGRLGQTQLRLQHIASKQMFRDPIYLFSADAQTLDLYATRLPQLLPSMIERNRAQLALTRAKLVPQGQKLCERFRLQIGVTSARLHDLSPLTVLARGYSITRTKEGAIIKSVDAVKHGSAVDVSLADGWLHCTVDAVTKEDRGFEEWEETPCQT